GSPPAPSNTPSGRYSPPALPTPHSAATSTPAITPTRSAPGAAAGRRVAEADHVRGEEVVGEAQPPLRLLLISDRLVTGPGAQVDRGDHYEGGGLAEVVGDALPDVLVLGLLRHERHRRRRAVDVRAAPRPRLG